MNKIIKCNLCGGEDFKFLFKNEDRLQGIPGEFLLWRCSCGLIFLNPQPDEKEIIYYYPDEYGPYNTKDGCSIDGNFLGSLEKVYYSPRGTKILQKMLLMPFRPLVRGMLVKKGGRLLDYGCGDGMFLEKMKRYGMEAYGLDFSPTAVSRAKSKELNIILGSLENTKFPENYFDIITLSHVFEHLHDPMKTLAELSSLLKKEGTMIVGVPNINSLGFKIFRKYWMSIDTPRHLFLYPLKTLNEYAKKAGLKIVRRSFASAPGFTLMSMDYWLRRYRKKEGLGKDTHLAKNLFLKLILFPITTLISWTPWGDTLEVWMRKE